MARSTEPPTEYERITNAAVRMARAGRIVPDGKLSIIVPRRRFERLLTEFDNGRIGTPVAPNEVDERYPITCYTVAGPVDVWCDPSRGIDLLDDRLCSCGEPGEFVCETSPVLECARCSRARLERQLADANRRFREVATELGAFEHFGDSCPHADQVRDWAVDRAFQLTHPAPAVERALTSGKALRALTEAAAEAWRREGSKPLPLFTLDGKEAIGNPLLSLKHKEGGPGLAARYPDATPAAKPDNGPVIVCDNGWGDDD